ncbi:MAG: PAS domain S-box protein [Acholeplasmatales bacterium]|nr:MAG: PAS domain S-box protein [Acholeplasmatales bacterium]
MRIKDTFTKQDEQLFIKQEQAINPPIIRRMFFLFAVLYAFFAITDLIYYPYDWQALFIIRFVIVIPLFLLGIVLSFKRFWVAHHQYYVAFCFFVGGAGTAYMLILHPENMVYYGGLFMVYFSGYLLVKLRFLHAMFAGLAILLFHFVGHMLINDDFSNTFVFGMTFYLGANLIGLVGAHQFEVKNRKQFLHEKEIQHIHDELKLQYTEKVTQFNQLEQSIRENKELIAKNEALDRLSKSLQESEQRFKTLHNASFGGIAIHDKGRILDCNQGLADTTGYALEELIGMDGLQLITPDSRERVMHKINTGDEKPYEAYGLRKNMEVYPVRIESRNIPHAGKQVRVTEFRDITELKDTQTALLKTLEQHQLVLNSTSSGIYAIDHQGLCTYVNENTVKLLGYENRAALLGKNIHALVHHSYEDGTPYPQDKCTLLRALESKDLVNVEDIIWRKDGTFFPVSYSSSPQIEDGKVVGSVVSFYDITERKQHEKALQESEENYRLLTTQMQFGLALHKIICDDDGQPVDYRFVQVNDAFEKLTGLHAEDIIGKTVKTVLPNTEPYWIDAYGAVALTGLPKRFDNYSQEIGKYFRVSAYSPKQDYFAVVIDDITEQRRLEQEREYLRLHDHLTGLTNRLFFDQQIKAFDSEENLPLAVINFDINGLKIINEAFGHDKGDKLIKHVASVLRDVCEAHCKEHCVISRVGGDQFAVIMTKTQTVKAEKYAKTIAKQVYAYSINDIQTSIAYGIAVKTTPEEDPEKLFIQAENAMYSSKIFESTSYRNNSIKAILHAYHEKNPREETHAHRVSDLCEKMGEALNMNAGEINMLKAISHLHDIGKIAIDEAILNKPGKLTDEEWEKIKKHPEIGARIIASSDEYAPIAEDILAHHERYDGTGYPRGLAKEAIPLRARITSIVDAYDAMVSRRPYRDALSHKDALDELRRYAGTQFDPELVEVFIRLFNDSSPGAG